MVEDREESQDADEVPDAHDVADGVGVAVVCFVWGKGKGGGRESVSFKGQKKED